MHAHDREPRRRRAPRSQGAGAAGETPGRAGALRSCAPGADEPASAGRGSGGRLDGGGGWIGFVRHQLSVYGGPRRRIQALRSQLRRVRRQASVAGTSPRVGARFTTVWHGTDARRQRVFRDVSSCPGVVGTLLGQDEDASTLPASHATSIAAAMDGSGRTAREEDGSWPPGLRSACSAERAAGDLRIVMACAKEPEIKRPEVVGT